ncbi:MAG: hypothetical protein OEM98_14790 [Gammaproteobacteria bacterium]|nr:hypothetical protein [Gammaproteobacteria bacterium]
MFCARLTNINNRSKPISLRLLPWQMRDLPLAGSDDVKARIYGLQLRLRGMASDADHGVRLIIEETIDVLRTALRRPASLQADFGIGPERRQPYKRRNSWATTNRTDSGSA